MVGGEGFAGGCGFDVAGFVINFQVVVLGLGKSHVAVLKEVKFL